MITAVGNLNDLSQADVQSALDTQGYTAIRAVLLDNLDATISSVLVAIANLSSVTPAEIWQYIIEGTLTAEQVQRIILSAVAGITTDDGQEFWDLAQIKKRIDGTVVSQNRTTVVLDGT